MGPGAMETRVPQSAEPFISHGDKTIFSHQRVFSPPDLGKERKEKKILESHKEKESQND